MEYFKFKLLKNLSVTLVLAGAFVMYSCGEATNYDDNDDNAGDSTISGLEGTRDQAAQMSTDVNTDTSSGQTSSVGKKSGIEGLPGDAGNTGSAPQAELFVADEVAGNYSEIKASTLAQQKSSNKEVKAVAGFLLKEHTAALADLKTIGAKKGLTLPTEENADSKSKMADIESKTGSEFDKAWCDMMMEKHTKTISKYEIMVNTVTDADVKSFINKVLPKIKSHHEKIMAVSNKVKA